MIFRIQHFYFFWCLEIWVKRKKTSFSPLWDHHSRESTTQSLSQLDALTNPKWEEFSLTDSSKAKRRQPCSYSTKNLRCHFWKHNTHFFRDPLFSVHEAKKNNILKHLLSFLNFRLWGTQPHSWRNVCRGVCASVLTRDLCIGLSKSVPSGAKHSHPA